MFKQILSVAALIAVAGCANDRYSRDDAYRSDNGYSSNRAPGDMANPSDGDTAVRETIGYRGRGSNDTATANPSDSGAWRNSSSGRSDYDRNRTSDRDRDYRKGGDMDSPRKGGDMDANRNAGRDMKHSGNSADAAFVHEAMMGGKMEVQLGQMAAGRAQNEDVRRFGQRMVDDHTKAGDDLMRSCGDEGMGKMGNRNDHDSPGSPDNEHSQMHKRLSGMNGADFDREYMRMMVEDHQKDVAAFEREAQYGQDSNVKAFAQRTLPTLREHLRMARDTASKLGVTTEGTPTRDDR